MRARLQFGRPAKWPPGQAEAPGVANRVARWRECSDATLDWQRAARISIRILIIPCWLVDELCPTIGDDISQDWRIPLVSLVLVSHSKTLAEGLRDMVVQVAGDAVHVAAAGGTVDGRLGTNAEAILEAIRAVDDGDGVLVLLDLGSAWLSVEMALDELSETEQARVIVSEAPLVEGAVLAAVQASVGASLSEVAAAAARAASMSKAPGG